MFFSTIDEPRLINFLVKSNVGDSYTHGNYLLRIENINPEDHISRGEVVYNVYCRFEKDGLERGKLIDIRITKNLPCITGIKSEGFYTCMTVLKQFFPKDTYNPFDEEDVKECE